MIREAGAAGLAGRPREVVLGVGWLGSLFVCVTAGRDDREVRRLEQRLDPVAESDVGVDAPAVRLANAGVEVDFAVDGRLDADGRVVRLDGGDQLRGDAGELPQGSGWLGKIDQQGLTDDEVDAVVGERQAKRVAGDRRNVVAGDREQPAVGVDADDVGVRVGRQHAGQLAGAAADVEDAPAVRQIEVGERRTRVGPHPLAGAAEVLGAKPAHRQLRSAFTRSMFQAKPLPSSVGVSRANGRSRRSGWLTMAAMPSSPM